MTKVLSGAVPIVPTPFNEDETIDQGALRNLIDFAIESRLQAVCLPAYASEFYKLTDQERLMVVKVAVEHARGRLQVVAQSNHPSLKLAIELAKANVDAGADIISLAVPRIFSLPEKSIRAYLSEFFAAIPDTPVLVQDFNPGGSSISVELINDLRMNHPNFKYLKLEEPLCAPKFESIIKATKENIGLFEGWGGLYLLELIPIGIAGVMPGLGVSDILQKIFTLRKDGENERAFDLFERIMPQIFFSLQNMELFHYAEKELLIARGVLQSSVSRKAAYIPDSHSIGYIKELNTRILQVVSELGHPYSGPIKQRVPLL
jgi:2-keto-3-deoxy-L-arabinonate dehydratase